MKTKSEKTSPKAEQQDEKVGSVDEIKRRYGFSSAVRTIHIYVYIYIYLCGMHIFLLVR